MSAHKKKVMIIGGGIAGLTAAWELAKRDIAVELVEKTCFLGGHAIRYCCKATDECVQCGACEVEKMLKNVVQEPAIQVHLATEVTGIKSGGGYTVALAKSSRPLEPQQIAAAGIRYADFPAEGKIARGYSKNNLPLYVMVDDAKRSSDSAALPEDTMALSQMGTAGELKVDAVVVASGFQPFNPAEKPTYGYGRFDNVITGLELEQIKREHGAVLRPSDGRPPQRVAFIQCVGSRDERLGHLWCSQVCCAYALRMARSLKYKAPDTEITVFYMDIQNTGRQFPVFYEKCKSEIQFVRAIPVDVFPMASGQLRLRYQEEAEGRPVDEIFDLLILSIGIMPGTDNPALADLTGVALDADGFIGGRDRLNTTVTNQNGIFVAGTAAGPKTITASMAHAGQAASEVLKYLGVIR